MEVLATILLDGDSRWSMTPVPPGSDGITRYLIESRDVNVAFSGTSEEIQAMIVGMNYAAKDIKNGSLGCKKIS